MKFRVFATVVLLVVSMGFLVGAAEITAASGDSFEDAEPISEGETQGEIVDGESDFYQIEANDTDALDLTVIAESDDILLRVYDESRGEIVSDTSFSSQERDVTYKLPETGTFFIEVEGDGEEVTTEYTIDLNIVTPDENDQFAPNDDFDSAAELQEGFSDATIWGGESDFFKIEANDTDALDLTVIAESDDILLRVYDESRGEIVSDTSFSSQERDVTYKLSETGTFFIEVEGDDQQATTDYTIDLDIVTPDENDQFAPNDDFESAAELPEGFSDATIWGGESDFYQIEANDTDALDLTVTAESDDIVLRVYDESRGEIVSDTSFSSQERDVTYKLPETGTFFIEVEGDGEEVTTDYTVELNIVTPDENDQFAPNDDFDSAAELPEGFSDATIWGGESDFFKIDLNVNEELEIEVTAQSDDVLLRVYGPDRSIVGEDTSFSSEERQATVEASESGTYFVEIEGDGQQVTTDYTILSNQAAESPIVDYANDDGEVEITGLRDAIDDWRAGDIDITLLRDVIDVWRSGEIVA